jgi:hypothetical protein
LVVTLIGVGGYLALLIAGAYAHADQATLRATALVWFLGFGAVKIALDVRASHVLARREPTCRPARRWDGRLG